MLYEISYVHAIEIEDKFYSMTMSQEEVRKRSGSNCSRRGQRSYHKASRIQRQVFFNIVCGVNDSTKLLKTIQMNK